MSQTVNMLTADSLPADTDVKVVLPEAVEAVSSKNILYTVGGFALRSLVMRNLTLIGSVVAAPFGAFAGLITTGKILKRLDGHTSSSSKDHVSSDKDDGSRPKGWKSFGLRLLRAGALVMGTGLGLGAGIFAGGVIGSWVSIGIRVVKLVTNGMKAFMFVKDKLGSSSTTIQSNNTIQ